ncbi:MAG: CAP domain-containing protein [Candidatus Dormibacteraeota bacterium]|nr:CAP domain-containing protein [Candidatus Dormibacteraeota bacterium]
MSLNLLDVAIVAVLGALIYDSLRRGFPGYLSELISLGVGLLLAFVLYRPLAGLLDRLLHVGPLLAGFGMFLVLMALVHGLVLTPSHRLAGWLSQRLSALTPGAYTALGVIPAAGLAVMIIFLLIGSLAVFPGSPSAWVQGSTLGRAVDGRSGPLKGPLRQLLLPGNTNNQRIIVSEPPSNPGEDAFFKLHFPASMQVTLAPDDEAAMLTKLNSARHDNGLSSIRLDAALREVARAHSKDMYARHYFSHQTPDGKTPYDRLREGRITYVTAGENLAFAPDVDKAWDSLMSSPDHRANILNPDFRCVGIGAYKGENGFEEMFTQDFTDCAK